MNRPQVKNRGRWRRSNKNVFLTPIDMAEAKRAESIAHAQAKREGKKIAVIHSVCGCGDDGCIIAHSLELDGTAALKKTPKRPTKRSKATHYMFSGNVS